MQEHVGDQLPHKPAGQQRRAEPEAVQQQLFKRVAGHQFHAAAHVLDQKDGQADHGSPPRCRRIGQQIPDAVRQVSQSPEVTRHKTQPFHRPPETRIRSMQHQAGDSADQSE